jgi:molybdopterin-binding protein
MTSFLRVKNLIVEREDEFKLKVFDLSVQEGEVLAVIGPNGAGKSTLLLSMINLIKPTSGVVFWQDKPIHSLNQGDLRRKFGLVLQEPLLLNTSVFENIASGLHFRRTPRVEIHERVESWMKRLSISHLHKRSARKLSGGEAHRTSLARAFVLEPELLLLDEPFGSLDAPTRTQLLMDLQSLLRTLHMTTIFVTHDLDEALLLADRVAVLIGGRLRQVGTPQEVFASPIDSEVAAFVGVETIVPGKIIACTEGMVTIQSNGFHLEAISEIPVGRDIWLCLRPEDVTLYTSPELPKSSARNHMSGKIDKIYPQGAFMRVIIDCGFPLVSLITRASAIEMGLKPGIPISASFKAVAAHLIPR